MSRWENKSKLLFLCWVIYASSYLGRVGFSANKLAIMADFGIAENKVVGLVGTMFFVAYGVGQLLHGTFCHAYNKRVMIPAVLLISGGINLTVFFLPTTAFGVVKYLWLLNGISLSVLWPSLMFVLSRPGNAGSVNRSTLVMSTPQLFGTFLTYGLSSALNALGEKFGNAAFYRGFFLFACVVTGVVAVVWFIFYPRVAAPEERLPFLPEKKPKTAGERRKIAYTELVFLAVIGVSAGVGSLLKDGLAAWAPNILENEFGTSDSLSIILSLVLPVCGFLGATVLVWLSKFIKDNLLLCGVTFLGAAGLIALLLAILGNTGVFYLIAFLLTIGCVYCLSFIINCLATTRLPLAMSDKYDSGMLSGTMNAFCYVGSAISEYGLGNISDAGGWIAVFRLLLVLTLLNASLEFFMFWREKPEKEA